MQAIRVERQIGGRTLSIETGTFAKLAHDPVGANRVARGVFARPHQPGLRLVIIHHAVSHLANVILRTNAEETDTARSRRLKCIGMAAGTSS